MVRAIMDEGGDGEATLTIKNVLVIRYRVYVKLSRDFGKF
jgi:hypothetical protein